MTTSLLKRKALIIPFIILLVAGIISIIPFSTPCACEPADFAFALFIGKQNPSELSTAAVTKGFSRQFPRNEILNTAKLPKFDEGTEFIKPSNDKLICNYWLELNPVSMSGYRITFALDNEGKIIEVKAHHIFSWFGLKFIDGKLTSNKAFNTDAV